MRAGAGGGAGLAKETALTAQAAATLPSPPAEIHKTLWVRRSNVTPTLYWWSLPLSLHGFATVFAAECRAACALVLPASVLAVGAAAVRGREVVPGVACVEDVVALLQACDEGRVGPCRLALFAPGRGDAALQRAARGMAADLDRQGFSMAIDVGGDGGMRHRFAFRVPGKVLEALQALALGRRFGGNLGQVEMALLQRLGLRPGQRARLQLVLRDGRATLQGLEHGGRRRVRYLESQQGFTGSREELTLREAVGERWRESWRRFPVGVVMFAGLPFFIGAFWVQHTLTRRRRPETRSD